MDFEKEKREAVEAGQRALHSLEEAKRQISGAKGFGLWDILGGGSFVSFAKHLKVDRARMALENARRDLQMFSIELRDLSMNLDVNISSFLTLFDLTDSFLADVIVQSRLSRAQRKIDETIVQVRKVLRSLN